MADIKINLPEEIEFSIVEFDDTLRSIKVQCSINVKELKGTYLIKYNFWVSCEEFDKFSLGETPILLDMSDVPRIEFEQFSEDERLNFIINSSIKNPFIEVDCKIKFKIEKNETINILTEFKNYPKWW